MAGEDTPGGLPQAELLQELGDALEGGLVAIDRDFVVRGWNRWLATASGMERSAVTGRALFDVFPELRAGQAETAVRRALGGATVVWSQQFHGFLLPLAPPAGYEAFARMQQSARIVPLVRDERVEGVLLLIQDVTERVAR